ncbi:MAG: hypothetical protein H0T73_16850, partial [Ardenticatenales bacterium]|nr:hypothetical protein [Ardenticatenales bacterium]
MALLSPTRWENQYPLNLLSNAVKFTERGHVTVRVAPTHLPGIDAKAPERDGVLVSVQDTGRDMLPEEAPQVFSEFVQMEGGRSKGGT